MQLLESTSARAVLSPEEELVLLIAAICHDLDHDGYTNSFHIHSQSPLAQQYNDKSGGSAMPLGLSLRPYNDAMCLRQERLLGG